MSMYMLGESQTKLEMKFKWARDYDFRKHIADLIILRNELIN